MTVASINIASRLASIYGIDMIQIIKFKNDLMDFVSDDVKLISAPLGEITILGTKFGVLLEANLALNCDVVSYETIKILGKCGWYTK